MNRFLLQVLGASLVATLATIGLSTVNAALLKTDMENSARMTRGCAFPSGGWTTIDSDNSTGNPSGTLVKNTSYAVQCDADAYVSFGGTVADSGDGWLAAGAIVRFVNVEGATFSVLNVSHATADCHYIECQ